MKKLLLGAGVLLWTIACARVEDKKELVLAVKPITSDTVFIQPLGNVSQKYITAMVEGVTKFYDAKVIVLTKVDLTNDLLTASKLRYSAPSILHKFHSNKNKLVLTEVDISTPDPRSPEWGIFGLGDCPGTTCTVSTFRIRKNATDSLILERLVKIGLHEIGHNYGLPHCEREEKCMMSAAHGTIKQVDLEKLYFCDYCRSFVEKRKKQK
jgi:archaemetzincin